jgi:hypothetical protein
MEEIKLMMYNKTRSLDGLVRLDRLGSTPDQFGGSAPE